jgi:hypothetical protein
MKTAGRQILFTAAVIGAQAITTSAGDSLRFCLLVHHTDAARE